MLGGIVLQVVLGLAFLVAGGSKLAGAKPYPENFKNWGYPQWFRYVTGAVEILGGLGMLVGIALNWLAPLAGLWLVCVMLGAMLTHLRAGDSAPKFAPAAVLLVLAAVEVALRWSTLGHLV